MTEISETAALNSAELNKLKNRFPIALHLDASDIRARVIGAALAADAQRPQPLKSGIEFAGDDLRRLQADDFANPGMLWVTRGERLWPGCAQSAADCIRSAARQ